MQDKILFDNVSFYYDDADEEAVNADAVLKNFNLTVEKGEFVALLGHNGCGKSTVAKLFNALLLPTSGIVTVFGKDTKDEKQLLETRKSVGLVLQNPDNQIVANIVEEDVAFGPENLGVPQPELRERVDNALKAVDMYEYRNYAPHKLSGGQKQRVAIAGIIAMEPKCIVLDEPTAMLDPKGREEVIKTIKKLNKEKNITIVLITHYMDEAAQADRVVVMDDGKILIDGTPREVFEQSELLKKHRLNVPQSTDLALKLKKAGLKIKNIPLTPEECAEAIIEACK